jgi:ABC-2 type transport system permease protein
VSQAGIGAGYLQNIIAQEALSYLQHREGTANIPINFVTRTAFNPNRKSEWFLSIMAIINFVTMLAIVLTGSALIRERERGTVEHLLVMPVRPTEIMIAKIWANGLVIVVTALLSLWFVAHGVLRTPLAGSMLLLVAGTVLYQFSVGALGILLATFAGTMGQFGLLMIPVLIILMLLSGTTTPYESMPVWIQHAMEFMPTTHFVGFAQSVLYRGAGFDIVWGDLAALATITVVFFGLSLVRFRTTIASS